MANTPICVIDQTGIHRPTLATILAYFTAQFQAIYGADVYLGSDTQDGEWIGLLASALDDANAMAVQAYNAFSPATAQGAGLSSNVKLNGLQRAVPSYSKAGILIVGQAGAPIAKGVVNDENGYAWALPASVVIPNSGQILVTATCTTPGAIAATPETVTEIANPQPGWQTASNPQAATPGAPVEKDAQLRARQSRSTMNSAVALLDGIVGTLLALPDVARARGYQNDGNVPDANGLPGNSIALVVDGGDANTILQTIWSKKGGAGTYGSVTHTIVDAYGVPLTVSYFPAQLVTITVAITIKQLQAFTSNIVAQIQQTVAGKINAIGIGNPVQFNRLFAAAYLFGAANNATFEVVSLAVARDGLTPTPGDISIQFFEAPSCVVANVTVTVEPY